MNSILMVDQQIKNASFTVNEGESFSLRLATFQSLSDCQIDVYVQKDATFDGVFADFAPSKSNIKLNVYLQGEGANGTIRIASLSKGDDKKKFEPSMIHQAKHTHGLVESYGICEDTSRLIFTGVSSIEKGASDSITRQSAKIIVFDEGCLGRCSPILKIDENAVQASHAAVVGKLNEDHLFYLLSRGLNISEARKLITQGYLLPISSYFEENERKKIEEAILKRL